MMYYTNNKFNVKGRYSMVEKNIYEILNTSQKDLDERPSETHDAYLLRKKNELVNYYSRLLEKAENFSEKEKRKTQISEVEEAYEKVSTAEKRAQYSAKIRAEIRAKEIREKYSHMSECRLDVISDKKDSIKEPFNNDFTKKMVTKIPNNHPEEIYLEDNQDRNLIIRHTATIEFRSSFNVDQMYVMEYEVTRTIGGEEVKDIVYTNLQISDLDFDDELGRPINQEYYNCVANELLSEDMIEGSKCNFGYIGQITVEQKNDSEKTYKTTLGEPKLERSRRNRIISSCCNSKKKRTTGRRKKASRLARKINFINKYRKIIENLSKIN